MSQYPEPWSDRFLAAFVTFAHQRCSNQSGMLVQLTVLRLLQTIALRLYQFLKLRSYSESGPIGTYLG